MPDAITVPVEAIVFVERMAAVVASEFTVNVSEPVVAFAVAVAPAMSSSEVVVVKAFHFDAVSSAPAAVLTLVNCWRIFASASSRVCTASRLATTRVWLCRSICMSWSTMLLMSRPDPRPLIEAVTSPSCTRSSSVLGDQP